MILVISAEGDGDAFVRYLTTAGFRVTSASGIPTSEIVDRTLATMPDMIVLDYDCDGETIERLKADRRTASSGDCSRRPPRTSGPAGID